MTIAGKPYPATLRVPQIAELYGYAPYTVRKLARDRNPKLPTPCTERPYGWNRADVQRHYERRTA